MTIDRNDPHAQARAADRAFKREVRKADAAERVIGEAARVAAIDEKTARLRALRLAKEAQTRDQAKDEDSNA